MRDPDALLEVLPHSQCQACGHAGCAPFARALAEGTANEDGCEPGGSLVHGRLLRRTGASVLLSAQEALAPLPQPINARINPEECIGCAKCLDACPVDAILGASRQLHVVIDEDCTGCGLCLPPCPVDCIDLIPVTREDWPRADSAAAQRIAASGHADCVACGACRPACPESLDPEAMFRAVREADWEPGPSAGLARCTLCGQCEPVCPSRIPLAAWFRQGKDIAHAVGKWEHAATMAREHHDRRVRRLAAPAIERLPSLPVLDALDLAAARDEIDQALTRLAATSATNAPRAME